MVSVNIIDYDGHAVSAGAETPGGQEVVLSGWWMHPDDAVADMQLAVYDSARLVARDRSRPEAEHGH